MNINPHLNELENILYEQIPALYSSDIKANDVEDLLERIQAVCSQVFKEYPKLIRENFSPNPERVQKVITRLQSDLKTLEHLLQSSLNPKKVTDNVIELGHGVEREHHVKKFNDVIKQLHQEIEDIQILGVVANRLNVHFGFSQQVRMFIDKFAGFLVCGLRQKINDFIFEGHRDQKIRAQYPAKIDKIKQQIDKFKEQIAKLEINQSQLLFKGKKVPDSIKIEIKNLNLKIQHLEEKLPKLEERLLKALDHQQKGKEIRQNLAIIGGESVSLNLQDENVTLNGTYLSANTFRDRLLDAGAESYTLSLGDGSINLKGIAFPITQENEVTKALNDLALGTAGWVRVETNTHTLLVKEEDIEELHAKGIVTSNYTFIEQSASLQLEAIDKTRPVEGGTVLLTSGSRGVYEMHKQEILAFLMRGMNVMAVNFRGYGESTGRPTGEGVKRDLEAAYEYIQKFHPVPDNKIVVKAICMSGGPASYLARKHPEMNVFLDQTYADFSNLLKREVKKVIKEYVKGAPSDEIALPDRRSMAGKLTAWAMQNFQFLANIAIRLAAPSWNTCEEMSHVKGNVGILLTTKDELISLDEDIKRNYESLIRKKKGQNTVSVFQLEGEHGQSWVHAHYVPRPIQYMNSSDANKLAFQLKIPTMLQNYFYVKGKIQKNMLPSEILTLIENAIMDLPDHKQSVAREFFSQAIKIDPLTVSNPDLAKERYEGRMIIDSFLKNAKLGSSLI